jgi:hypothetical protein
METVIATVPAIRRAGVRRSRWATTFLPGSQATGPLAATLREILER